MNTDSDDVPLSLFSCIVGIGIAVMAFTAFLLVAPNLFKFVG